MQPDQLATIPKELQAAAEAFRAGDATKSESIIERLFGAYPDRADVQMAKGMLMNAKGDQHGALHWIGSSLIAEPNNTEALAWASSLSLSLGQPQQAEGFARRFVELAPGLPRAYILLGTALGALERYEEALAAVDRCLILKPEGADALLLKARLLSKWKLPGLAVEFYRKVLAIQPSAPAAIDLSQVLLRESHPEEALAVLQRVMPLMPEPLRPYDLMARAYSQMRRFEEADANWDLAEKHAHNPTVLRETRAWTEISAGRFELAESLLQPLLVDDSTAPQAFWLLTTARKLKPDELPLAEKMVALLRSGRIPNAQKIRVNFALGKAFDDLNDFERAIGFFDEANRLNYEINSPGDSFSFEAARALTDFQIGYFSKARLIELSKEGNPTELPIFVVGMARSGTTLTENILSSHSQVRAGGEQAFWSQRVIEFYDQSSGTIHWDLVRGFANEYLAMLKPESQSIRHVVDKNPANIYWSAMLHGTFPNAKFVHLTRNPADNLLSIWMNYFGEAAPHLSKRENLVFIYREYLRLVDHLRTVIPEDRFCTFRYEELTSNPRPTITSMLGFLDLEIEAGCFEPEKNARAVLTPSVRQVRQPINRSSQARWKNYEPWLGAFSELLEGKNSANEPSQGS